MLTILPLPRYDYTFKLAHPKPLSHNHPMPNIERLAPEQLFRTQHDDIIEWMLDIPGFLPDDKILALTGPDGLTPVDGMSEEEQVTINALGRRLAREVDSELIPKEPSPIVAAILKLQEARRVLNLAMFDGDHELLDMSSQLGSTSRELLRLGNSRVMTETRDISRIIRPRDDLFVAGFIPDGRRRGGVAAQLVGLRTVTEGKIAHPEPVVSGVEGAVGLLPRPIRLFGIHALHSVNPTDKALIMDQRRWDQTQEQKDRAMAAYNEIRGITPDESGD
jgi:hypothetical protein